MSSLTQFFGGGSGIGTVYTYAGNFSVNNSSIGHTFNLNLNDGYNISQWSGLTSGGSNSVNFNINSSVPTDPFSSGAQGGPTRSVSWSANGCGLACDARGNIASGSIQILY